MEDKKKIIEAFGEVMKMTRNYSDMVSLEYVKKEEKSSLWPLLKMAE